MANQPRARKRVHAIRRAPDGSAFEKCHYCGSSVAIAVSDMHECETKKGVKRIKLESGNWNITKQSFQEQPKSPFRFFMENFTKTCENDNLIDIDRKGAETWKNMSKKERLPYVLQAEKVNSAYEKVLLQESEDTSWMMRQIQQKLESMMRDTTEIRGALMALKASAQKALSSLIPTCGEVKDRQTGYPRILWESLGRFSITLEGSMLLFNIPVEPQPHLSEASHFGYC